jgi:hypothetical protein
MVPVLAVTELGRFFAHRIQVIGLIIVHFAVAPEFENANGATALGNMPCVAAPV